MESDSSLGAERYDVHSARQNGELDFLHPAWRNQPYIDDDETRRLREKELARMVWNEGLSLVRKSQLTFPPGSRYYYRESDSNETRRNQDRKDCIALAVLAARSQASLASRGHNQGASPMTPSSLIGTIIPNPALVGMLIALGLLPFFIPVLIWRMIRAVYHGSR